jgi:hypothetical protein
VSYFTFIAFAASQSIPGGVDACGLIRRPREQDLLEQIRGEVARATPRSLMERDVGLRLGALASAIVCTAAATGIAGLLSWGFGQYSPCKNRSIDSIRQGGDYG